MNVRLIVFLCLPLLFPLFLISQETSSRFPLKTYFKAATLYPLSITEDWRPHMRNTRKIHTPGANLYKDEIRSLKKQVNASADALRSRASTQEVHARKGGTQSPVIQGGFQANGYSGAVPNDNDIAISPEGMIVSVTNELIHVYDTLGTQLLNLSLAAFGGSVVSSGKVFDPRVIFDPVREKFVVVYLNGATAATSKLIVGFSSTSNPTGAWHFYALQSNLKPSGIDVWADFPQIGLSKEELFITCNLFTDNGDAPGTGVWQINLEEGFTGDSLVTGSHFISNTFHITPVKGATDTYGPGLFFIRKSTSHNDGNFTIYQIDNTLAHNGKFLTPVTLTAASRYFLPPDIVQKGTTQKLEMDEGRMQAAYKKGDRIYFVMSNGVNSRSSLYYGKVLLSPLALSFSSVTGTYIEHDTLEMGFPNIAFGGNTSAQGESDHVIMFNFASPYHFPGNGVVHIDTAGNVSDPVICAEGARSHGFGNVNQAYRWGDYTGIAIRKPGEVWVAGYDVRSDGRNTTWISQVIPSSPGIVSPIENKHASSINGLHVYPSPAIDQVFFDFSVAQTGIYTAEIFDLQGRMIHRVMEDKLKAGDARVGFNTMLLANGMYMIRIQGEKGSLLSKRFLVAH